MITTVHSGISPDLVPHTRFHKGCWLQSTARPGWYYFRRKEDTNAISNRRFPGTVDGPLRRLVNYLHKAGIRTTPSCSGHNKSGQGFDKIFNDLAKDSEAIRTTGLELKDVESGKIICYRNSRYKLPWDEKTFLKKLSDYQHHGVLGLRLGNRKKIKEALLKLHIPGVKFSVQGGIVLILTNEEQQQSIAATWNRITQEVIEVINSSSLQSKLHHVEAI